LLICISTAKEHGIGLVLEIYQHVDRDARRDSYFV